MSTIELGRKRKNRGKKKKVSGLCGTCSPPKLGYIYLVLFSGICATPALW